MILTILLFLLALGILGCVEGEWENNDPALKNIADGQIMGMTRHYKPTPIKVIEVIEKDDYGRILFKTSNALTFDLGMSRVTAYIIAQKEDGETGYCLPDICYELVQYGGRLNKGWLTYEGGGEKYTGGGLYSLIWRWLL